MAANSREPARKNFRGKSMKKGTSSFIRVALGCGLSFATLFGMSEARAGEVLHLRSLGDLHISGFSSKILSQGPLDEVRTLVIQYSHQITPADESLLSTNGISVLRYLPDDALIVRGTDDQIRMVRLLDLRIRAISEYRPEWKVSPQMLALGPARPGHRDLILVSALAPDAASAVRDQLARDSWS